MSDNSKGIVCPDANTGVGKLDCFPIEGTRSRPPRAHAPTKPIVSLTILDIRRAFKGANIFSPLASFSSFSVMLLGEYAQYLDHPSVLNAPDYDDWDCREPYMNNDPLCKADVKAPLVDIEEILSLEGLVESKEGDGKGLGPSQPDVPTAQSPEEADEGQPAEELTLRATATAGPVPSSVRDLRAAKRRRSSAASLPDTKKVRLAGNKENPDVDRPEDEKEKLVQIMMKAQKCGLTDIDALKKALTPDEWELLIYELK
ncbi:hypothetical protein PQX77_005440, partial [Marasmius sp. AFHP31]